ncbi:MAG TPA: hypothetical protein VJ044_11555, partial [Candidatus Hodarchaeales archaeon]|nr:hypothetical protein [Candidatus Hodarchaeales archaeon]
MTFSAFGRVIFKLFLGILSLVLGLLFVIQTAFFKKQAAGYLENYLRNNYQLRVELPSLDYQPGSVLVFRLKNPRIYGGEQQQNVFLRANSIEARVPLS